jgi:hypothetical protein
MPQVCVDLNDEIYERLLSAALAKSQPVKKLLLSYVTESCSPYNNELKLLGMVTVAFSLLETMTESLLKSVAGAEEAEKKRFQAIGQKLNELEKSAKRRLAAHADILATLNDWIADVRKISRARNRAAKSPMFYGYAPMFPGLVAIREGKAKLVSAEDLTRLIEDLNRAGDAGGKLGGLVASSLGAIIEEEEEEEENDRDNAPSAREMR